MEWLYSLIGVIVGSLVTLGGQFFLNYRNDKKEARRLHIETVAKLSGSFDLLMNIVFRAMESRIWLHYIYQCEQFGVKTPFTLPSSITFDRENLLASDRIRGEIEKALSEYWGHIGSSDTTLIRLIEKYRKCSMPEVHLPAFKDKNEIERFDPSQYTMLSFATEEKKEDSYFSVSRQIVAHLRTVMAPMD